MDPLSFIVLAGIMDFISDMSLILKIFVLVTIIQFVRQHVENTAIATVIILVAAYFILFMNWKLFGGIYFVYLLFVVGISGILVDFFFVMPHKPQAIQERPDLTGIEEAHRMHQAQEAMSIAHRIRRGH